MMSPLKLGAPLGYEGLHGTLRAGLRACEAGFLVEMRT